MSAAGSNPASSAVRRKEPVPPDRDSRRDVFRWSRPRALRVAGLLAAVVGVLWLAAVGFAALTPGRDRVLLVSTAAAAGLGLLAAVGLVIRPPKVLTLTSAGYAVHHVRGAGVSSAPWTAVASVRTQDLPDGPALVLQLARQQRSVVPLALLGRSSQQVHRCVRERLDAAAARPQLSA